MGAEMGPEEDYPGQNREIKQHEFVKEFSDRLHQATHDDEDYRQRFVDVSIDLIRFMYGRRRVEGGSELFREVVESNLERFTSDLIERKYLAGLLLADLVSGTLVTGTSGAYNASRLSKPSG